ncbi:MAG: GGDEF domain-containing protein [Sphingomicrobium sp.]
MLTYLTESQTIEAGPAAESLVREVVRLRTEVEQLRTLVKELDGLAHQDPLVDLPNRRSFMSSLQNLISRVERYGHPAAMLFVDVDGLKKINDMYGHTAGDAALVRISQLLVASVRNSDTVGRLAGDEFGILFEQADELSAWQMGLRVVEAVTHSHFEFEGKRLRLSVAVGVGVITPGDDPQTVIARADQQMYRIKAA